MIELEPKDERQENGPGEDKKGLAVHIEGVEPGIEERVRRDKASA